MNKDKEIADKLDNLASCIAQGSVSAAKLRDSISDIRYAIAKLRTSVENNLGAYANYDKCIRAFLCHFTDAYTHTEMK